MLFGMITSLYFRQSRISTDTARRGRPPTDGRIFDLSRRKATQPTVETEQQKTETIYQRPLVSGYRCHS